MKMNSILIYLVLIYFGSTYCFVDLSFFRTLMSNLVDDKNSECSNSNTPKEMCDENQIMLLLAKLYITSPERVLLLITADSLSDTCKGVSETMDKINKTQTGCIALSSDNLYMKLLKAVQFLHSSVCKADTRLKKKITRIGDCLPELREEFLDCEGFPDWYENKNQTVRCQAYNDIVNCNYVKTAMLCGLEPAALIRAFSTELLQQALPSKPGCKVSRSLPFVQDPMPADATKIHIYTMSHLTLFILLIKTISNS